MLRKILVAIDGSDQSYAALTSALEIALGCRVGELEVISVVPGAATMIGIPVVDVARAEKYAKEAVAKAEKIAKEKVPGILVKTKVEAGNAAQMVVQEARDGKFDLIVVGRRGHGGVPRAELGSVSRKIVDWATVPVLVIK